MNIYSKILVATLPLVFALVLSTVGTTYYFSRAALTEMAENWLDTRLSEAMAVVAGQQELLVQYGLARFPASVLKSQLDAGRIMSAIPVGEMGAVFAVNADGIVVCHPDRERIGNDVSQRPWFRQLRKARFFLIHPSEHGPCLAAVDFFEPWGWTIFASDPAAEIYGVAGRMTPYLVGLGVTGFVIMAGVLMLLARRLTGPLRKLTRGAEQIGKGELDTHIHIVSRDEFGRLAGVFNQMAVDLQKTMTTLTHREAHFRSMIENATDLIIILDADGKMVYLSPSVHRMLGYRSDEILARTFCDYVHAESRDRFRQHFAKCLNTSRPLPAETARLRHADGSWRSLEVICTNLLAEPAVNGVVINARDITKREEAESALQQANQRLEERVAERTAALKETNRRLRREIEEREQMTLEKERLQNQLMQSQKMEAIGTLAGGIAHDFNNLLMGIQGNVEMMSLDIAGSGRHAKRMQTIQACVTSGTQLTQQLLGFARLGKYEVKATDPNDLIDKCTAMFGRTRQELRIVSRFQSDVWAVNVDRGQMEQVLLNLLINAWQAMPEGGTVTIETANESLPADHAAAHQVTPGKYVKIAIADHGIGMDPETMERIFDPFFTTKTIKRGTGLGLASAYGIVRNHGGFIDVTSAPGQGATFCIHLKAIDTPLLIPAAPRPSPSRGTETILIVDDDAMIVDIGQAMLSTLGYDVLTANGGRDAIDVYERHRNAIDLVILDMIMPDMGGGRTFDAIKRINPAVKVILASGYSLNGQASDILKRGCHGFIQKPFHLQAISEKVRAVLDRSD